MQKTKGESAQEAIGTTSEPGDGSGRPLSAPAGDLPVKSVPAVDPPQRTILLVDDEELLLRMGARLLGELGFTVLTADSGQRALEIAGSDAEIALVLLDLVMPQMDGDACFRELRKLRPDMRVLISSGFSEQEIAERFPCGDRPAGFIQKPYSVSALRKLLRENLESAAADA